MSERDVDQELVERVQSGDKKAFDLLMLKYQQRVVNLVYRYVKNQADALDISQEAFIKAYRALPNFRGESAFYTWLYRIAINTAKNHLLAQSRRPPSMDMETDVAEQIDPGYRLRDEQTPESSLLSDEIASTIKLSVDELPEDLRTAITLREMEGLSYEEIAEVMECPIGTVRSRIFRAREAINNKIAPLMN